MVVWLRVWKKSHGLHLFYAHGFNWVVVQWRGKLLFFGCMILLFSENVIIFKSSNCFNVLTVPHCPDYHDCLLADVFCLLSRAEAMVVKDHSLL
jgi:hypothetical protein